MGNRFFVLQSIQIGSVTHPAFCEVGIGSTSLVMEQMPHHHLVQRSTVSGTIPLLSHMPAWHAQELHLYLIMHVCNTVEAHVLSPSAQPLHFFSTIDITIAPMLKLATA